MSVPDPVWSPEVFASRRRCAVVGEPSAVALQSVLTFGAILPPSLPWRESGPKGCSAYDASLAHTADALRQRPTHGVPAEVEREAVSLLDQQLVQALDGGKKPVVLFSGGVDSSLIAARLRHLGHGDALLVHYQFSPDDPETQVAREMAAALGMDLEIVQRDHTGLRVLEKPGQTYPMPFGDHSTVPTAELCLALPQLASAADTVVFDGTGADGAFGLGGKSVALQKLLRVPSLARSVGSTAYAKGGWAGPRSLEYRLRVLRRAATLSPATAVIAQNSLYGVLYDAPALPQLDADWNAYIAGLVCGDLTRGLVLTDLTITCAGIFAQKSLGPLMQGGFQVCYPFLSTDLGALGMLHTARWPTYEAKAWMKVALARVVDPALVHRPKSGFIEPEMTLFDTAAFRAALDGALSPSGVAQDLLRHRPLRSLVARTPRLGSLPHGHLNLLWALAFTDRWYQTAS